MSLKTKINTRLMGSDFELIVAGDDENLNHWLLNDGISEIKRIEELLTEFKETSYTSAINKHAGVAPIRVTAEVYDLIRRSVGISALSQGAFDITAGVLKKLYNFKTQQVTLPTQQALRNALKLVGYKLIQLKENNQVYLPEKGMRISFAAIGKGYAADRVKALWMAKGVKSGVINASGDLTAWGMQPDGTPWKIGIADPDNIDEVLLWLPVNNASVATSGNYIQYFEIEGIRYSHNIDPHTGMPAKFIKSVTIVSPSAELSDALATAVTIMGIEAGLYFIDQLPDVHCIIIDQNNKIYQSKNINIHAKV